MTKYLSIPPGHVTRHPARGATPALVHQFDRESIDAVNMALAAARPLLVRGEPGTGKSQLARAVSHELGRVLLTHVVDARTEARDLQWSLDSVARLAEAQVRGAEDPAAAPRAVASNPSRAANVDRLDQRRFLQPEALWWAFDWPSARSQAELARRSIPSSPASWKPADGCVVLIDEIDKADSSVPNGLLECLGSGRIHPPGYVESVAVDPTATPLVIITTNEERVLPNAFLRRCLVLRLGLPALDGTAGDAPLTEWLTERGRIHFPKCSRDVLVEAARQLCQDRKQLLEQQLAPPGQAEYLDLLRALTQLEPKSSNQLKLLGRLAGFALRKHPQGRGA